MSFSPPTGPPANNGSPPIHKRMPMRRPVSTSSLFTVTQTSTNLFQRRPQRPALHRVVSAQTLPLASSTSILCLNEEDAEGQLPPARRDAEHVSEQDQDERTSVFSSCRSTTSRDDEDYDDTDSELSDHDLWNSAMQRYLLDSDDDSDLENEDHALSYTTGSLGDQLTTSPFLVTNVSSFARQQRREAPTRKRSAKKAVRSTTGAARMTPSHSSQTLDAETAPKAALKAKVSTKPPRRKNVTHRYLLAPLLSGRLADGTVMGPLTIVFDIDETLVSARDDDIYVRPFVKELLDLCAALRCEVIVWTAGIAEYVNPILRKISVVCGRTDWYHHVISRHKRWYSEEKDCCKDLSLLNRPLDRVLLLENNPVSVVKQSQQCILVEDYVAPNEADESLKHVASIVRRLVYTMSSAQTPTSTPPLGPMGSNPSPVPRRPVDSVLPREAALVSLQFLLYEVLQHDIDHTGPPPENLDKLSCFALRYSPSAASFRRTYGGIVPLS